MSRSEAPFATQGLDPGCAPNAQMCQPPAVIVNQMVRRRLL
jgi:hypothetical protein